VQQCKLHLVTSAQEVYSGLTEQALIYPGLGHGAILAEASKMTDKMIVAGSKRLSELAPALQDPSKALLPDFGGECHQGRWC
jgi:malate dehydrogenase (oxaloacetate-decarboxylating)